MAGRRWCWSAYFSESEPNGVVLADAGFAVLLANQRGSTGRGHAFAQGVIGDPRRRGLRRHPVRHRRLHRGRDRRPGSARDRRVVVRRLHGRLGGRPDDRFKAAVAMSVVADFRSLHLTSEVAAWDEGILDGRVGRSVRRLHDRSPVVHAHRCVTPTLVTAGELDRCTPVEQGVQLYRRSWRPGAETELVIYPREGHVVGRARARARPDPAHDRLVRTVSVGRRLIRSRDGAGPTGRHSRRAYDAACQPGPRRSSP